MKESGARDPTSWAQGTGWGSFFAVAEQERLLEITQYLQAAATGNRDAIDELVPLVYQEMHGLAHQRLRRVGPGSSLETSDLLHESWERLLKAAPSNFENRRHFFGAAARAMRNILIEQARKNSALKRDSKRNEALTEDLPDLACDLDLDQRIAVGDALEKLKETSPRPAEVVWQRFFNQIPFKEIAEVLGISENTVGRDWKFARSWLQDALGDLPDAATDDLPAEGDDE